jgi:hypothetical protein
LFLNYCDQLGTATISKHDPGFTPPPLLLIHTLDITICTVQSQYSFKTKHKSSIAATTDQHISFIYYINKHILISRYEHIQVKLLISSWNANAWKEN